MNLTNRTGSATNRLLRRVLALFALVAATEVSFGQQPNWPDLYQRAGPFSGLRTSEDFQDAARDGFTLTLTTATTPRALEAMRPLHIKFLYSGLWTPIRDHCVTQFEAERREGLAHKCELSPNDERSIIDSVKRRLNAVENEPDIVGYWILGDYPWANISSTLATIHSMVAQANRKTGMRKPTVCGIGGSLDRRTAVDSAFKPNRRDIELSLSNVTPNACDIVAPYFYGVAAADDPTWVDWTMANLLPWFIGRLRQRGFDHPILLPVLQAFSSKTGSGTYYVKPNSEDIVEQARAYCKLGTIALLFFTWRSPDSNYSYINDSPIRKGVRTARTTCWAR